MDTGDSKKKQEKKGKGEGRFRWAIQVFFLSVVLSAVLSLASEEALDGAGMALAFVVLACFILLGIVFDIIGVAVTAADERPFHSMAAHRTPGAREALGLIRKANKVSSFCNDVVGDICGVVSGSASAVIAAAVIRNFEPTAASIFKLFLSALVAALTVGGKAVGKAFAINASTPIIHFAAKLIYRVKAFFRWLRGLFGK